MATFTISRSSRLSLVEQLFRALRQSIISGQYRSGEYLPGIGELAQLANVSEKVSRQALARLAEIGWCATRRGRRSVVVERDKNRQGRVLFFNAGSGYDFHSSWLVGALRPRLLKEDICLTTISAFDLRHDGSSPLLHESLKEHWDLVVEFGMRPGSRRDIECAGWPFIVLGDGGKCISSSAANCVGKVELRNGKAAPAFVRACVRAGVRRVVQFIYAEGGFDVTDMLKMPGIRCMTIRIPRCHDQFDMYKGGYDKMVGLLDKSRCRLPDVFLFTDDHLAYGGLLALMERGIRVPDDVKVVTHANRGWGPFWIKPMTRIEMDPVAQGESVADAIISFLQGGKFPQDLFLGSEWKDGQTF